MNRPLRPLWRLLYLALFPVVLLAFHHETSHTIVFKDTFFAAGVVWILAWRWMSEEGWRAADLNPRFGPGEKLHLGLVSASAFLVLYLVSRAVNLPARDPGLLEIGQDLATVVLVLALCLPIVQRIWNSPGRLLLLPVAGWAFALAVTAVAAGDLVISAITLHRYVLVLALLLLGMDLLRERRYLQELTAVLVTVVGILSVYGLFQSLEIDFFEWRTWTEGADEGRRIAGALGNPNFFAGFLAGALPLCIAVAVAVHQRRGLFVPVLLVITLGLWSLYKTGSMGGAVGFAIGLFFLLLLTGVNLSRDYFRTPAGRRFALRAGGGLALVGVLGGVAALVAFLGYLDANEDRMISFQSRKWMWVGAARMLYDEPITGLGPGNFAKYFPDYRPVELSAYKPPDRYRVDHPHSEWLEIAAEMGLLGFLAFLWLVMAFTLAGLRAIARSPDPFRRWILVGALAGMAAMLGHGLVSVHLRWITSLLLFWTLLALVGSSVPVAAGSPSPARPLFPVLRRPRYLVFAAGLLAASSVMAYQALLLHADFRYQTGRVLLDMKQPAYAATYLQQSLQLNPRFNDARYFLGSAYYDNNMYEQALQEYNGVLRNGRNFVHVFFNKATILQKMGRYDEAIAVYQESLRNDPNYARLHDYLGRAWYQKAREQDDPAVRDRLAATALEELERAAELYQDAVAKSPWDANLHKDYGISLLLIGEYAKARAALSEALRLDPEMEIAERFMQHAEKIEELAQEKGDEAVREILFGTI